MKPQIRIENESCEVLWQNERGATLALWTLVGERVVVNRQHEVLSKERYIGRYFQVRLRGRSRAKFELRPLAGQWVRLKPEEMKAIAEAAIKRLTPTEHT
ncbi:MAG: hypothetical protein IT462_11515 [Planctomycetes bacterium]|nr:hypothetical protein [Planctomycetota bacterium]